MNQARSSGNNQAMPRSSGLSGLRRQPLTPEQQLQALKRVQAQAEQRVKLGMQLFKAAEARLSNQTDLIQQIKTLQKQLREQVNNDVAQTLHQYDQWIGQIDESFTTAIRKLEEKIDAVQANVTVSEKKMRQMLDRAEALLDQTRCLLEEQSLQQKTRTTPSQPTAEPAQDDPPPPDPEPTANADQDLSTAQPHLNLTSASNDDAEQDKIYSKLLQRLINDPPATDTDQDRDNADAA